ncbi:hypothetical protein GCM10010116_33120 [Microbispora rosea subsp. aerata]|nr:hypothetical protein [Microbispora rosea]GGO16402.1 hypothetical protein GCM10010116_33120 [Microbispora rosea subsp. aerata]GIH55915.1 hypothetical protein Mro02_28290 [Microbispora rosea subsp. aerata]GLJ83171.1 hypothetical protein GCM10017588_18980 [Microbispora rosea subsp. aerata]
MILILRDRQDTAARRVLPETRHPGASVTRWDSGESVTGSRAATASESERVVPEIDQHGARTPVEESAESPAGDADAARPAA